MKTTVIYHSADFDGIFCREIARKFLPEAELIGWDFADKPLMAVHPGFNQKIYVLDLPIDKPFGLNPKQFPDWVFESVVWIDHHKSSIESHPQKIPGYRIDGVAACRLTWQWFANSGKDIGGAEFRHLPPKEDFIDRNVSEPTAVRLAGEYDIWDKRDTASEQLQFGLRSRDLTAADWKVLLRPYSEPVLSELLDAGQMLQRYQQRNDASVVGNNSFLCEWEGLRFLTLNTTRFNSLTFAAKDVPETGHDALMGFNWNGKVWTVSLYHANHRKDIDLSLIAVKHGGGGHRGACGFTCKNLPFLK